MRVNGAWAAVAAARNGPTHRWSQSWSPTWAWWARLLLLNRRVHTARQTEAEACLVDGLVQAAFAE